MTVAVGKIHDRSLDLGSGGKKLVLKVIWLSVMTGCSFGTSFLVPAMTRFGESGSGFGRLGLEPKKL